MTTVTLPGFLNISKAADLDKANKQWQGIYPNATKDMSFCWGGTTKRTAAQALLRSIRAVLGVTMKNFHLGPNIFCSLFAKNRGESQIQE